MIKKYLKKRKVKKNINSMLNQLSIHGLTALEKELIEAWELKPKGIFLQWYDFFINLKFVDNKIKRIDRCKCGGIIGNIGCCNRCIHTTLSKQQIYLFGFKIREYKDL